MLWIAYRIDARDRGLFWLERIWRTWTIPSKKCRNQKNYVTGCHDIGIHILFRRTDEILVLFHYYFGFKRVAKFCMRADASILNPSFRKNTEPKKCRSIRYINQSIILLVQCDPEKYRSRRSFA